MLLRGNVSGHAFPRWSVNAGGTPALQGVAHARKRGRMQERACTRFDHSFGGLRLLFACKQAPTVSFDLALSQPIERISFP